MASIGPNVTKYIEGVIHSILLTYMDSLDSAFQASENGIKFSLPVSIKPGRVELDVEVGISGVTGRIKDKIKGQCSENQVTIFDKDGKEGV